MFSVYEQSAVGYFNFKTSIGYNRLMWAGIFLTIFPSHSSFRSP